MSTVKTNEIRHTDGTTTTEPSIPALDQRMAKAWVQFGGAAQTCLLYTSPSPRDKRQSRMPSSA